MDTGQFIQSGEKKKKGKNESGFGKQVECWRNVAQTRPINQLNFGFKGRWGLVEGRSPDPRLVRPKANPRAGIFIRYVYRGHVSLYLNGGWDMDRWLRPGLDSHNVSWLFSVLLLWNSVHTEHIKQSLRLKLRLLYLKVFLWYFNIIFINIWRCVKPKHLTNT